MTGGSNRADKEGEASPVDIAGGLSLDWIATGMSNRLRMMRFAAAAAIAASWGPVVAIGAGPQLKVAPRLPAPAVSVDKLRAGMVDIALDNDRTLRGRFVDTSGAPIDGAVVTLRQSDRVIARSTTLADGSFTIDHVSTGAYRLTCGSATGQIRCWSSDVAPPNAVVDGVTFQDNVVRGQAVAVAPALLGRTSVTTVAASATAIGGVAAYTSSRDSRRNPVLSADATSEPQLPMRRPGQTMPQASLVRYDGDARWAEYEQTGKYPLPSDVSPPPNWSDDGFAPASP